MLSAKRLDEMIIKDGFLVISIENRRRRTSGCFSHIFP